MKSIRKRDRSRRTELTGKTHGQCGELQEVGEAKSKHSRGWRSRGDSWWISAANAVEHRRLVSGRASAWGLYRFSQSPPYRAQYERRDLTLGSKRKIGSPAWKFRAMIQLEPCLAQKLGGKSHVLRAIHTPEPQLFLMPLQEVQGFLEFLHRAVKRRSQEENSKIPGVAGIENLDPDTVLARLIALHATPVVIAHRGRASWRLFRIHKILRFRHWRPWQFALQFLLISARTLNAKWRVRAGNDPLGDTHRLPGCGRKNKRPAH